MCCSASLKNRRSQRQAQKHKSLEDSDGVPKTPHKAYVQLFATQACWRVGLGLPVGLARMTACRWQPTDGCNVVV